MGGSRSHFRKGVRRAFVLRVRFRRDEPGAALEQAGRTADVGLGGAFVETHRPLAVGTGVVLILNAPTAWNPLEIRGEVRWVSDGSGPRPTGFGVRFVELDRTHAAALYDLLHAVAFAEPST